MAVVIKPWRMLSILTEDELNFLSNRCNELPQGDIVCAGCYMGGDIIEISKAINNQGKNITVIDSFDGLNEADAEDLETDTPMVGGQCKCDFESVVSYLKAYEVKNTTVHKMWITEDNMKLIPKSKMSLLWLDLDRYMPTYVCLKVLWPWLNDKGWILIHDYGFEHTPGVKTAVEKFNEEFGISATRWKHQVGGIWGMQKVG
jgi:hypothetical protein